jgi:hypothetical protein
LLKLRASSSLETNLLFKGKKEWNEGATELEEESNLLKNELDKATRERDAVQATNSKLRDHAADNNKLANINAEMTMLRDQKRAL